MILIFLVSCEELFEFDVVVFGDVCFEGVGRRVGGLMCGDFKNFSEFVVECGGGLVVIVGFVNL